MENSNGLTHIICGDGKGKTTAAIGLSIRAAGRGQKVLITRFLKSDDSGELTTLKKIDSIMVLPVERFFGFTWQMSEQEKEEATIYYQESFRKAVHKATQEKYDLLILDELISAYNYGFLNHEEVIEFLRTKPKHLEVVMTGRKPAKELCDLADYISEIMKRKHPYEQGVPARIGIEY